MEKKTISIITPCFNEDSCIEDCYNKIKLLFDPVFKIRELPARKKELLNFKVDNNYYYLE